MSHLHLIKKQPVSSSLSGIARCKRDWVQLFGPLCQTLVSHPWLTFIQKKKNSAGMKKLYERMVFLIPGTVNKLINALKTRKRTVNSNKVIIYFGTIIIISSDDHNKYLVKSISSWCNITKVSAIPNCLLFMAAQRGQFPYSSFTLASAPFLHKELTTGWRRWVIASCSADWFSFVLNQRDFFSQFT